MSLPALPDLHRHLDGSLRKTTLEELARAAGKRLPPRLTFSRGMGLEDALARFAFTLAALQDPAAVRRVAGEICEDAAREGVTTLEVRFAPQLHRGATVAGIVDAALEGLAGRAGLVLCGLYGESPAVLDELVAVAAHRPGVVGIDLAGGPSPTQRWIMEDYARAFRRAAELGLGRTVHAGEGRDPDEIRVAVEVLGAQRIGHGTTLLQDPEVTALVVDRGVTIEACPTSNVHTGVIADVREHPLVAWQDRGVRVCINSDNTLFSDTDARREHEKCLKTIPGLTAARLERAIACGHEAAFRRPAS